MALPRLIRCVNLPKLFPSPQRSLTNPWLVSSPGTAALPPKLLRGIASIAPQLPSSSPSPQPQQEAAAAAPSSNRSRKPRKKTKAADGGGGGAAAVPTPPLSSPSISPEEVAGGAASTQAKAAATSSPMIVSDGGGAAAASASQEEAASSRKRRKAKAKASTLPEPRAPSCRPPKTPRQMAMLIKYIEKRRLMLRMCPPSHANLPKGKGQYLYTPDPLTGELYGYIPTPDEVFPPVLDPRLREDEAKYLRETFANDPDSIAKPGEEFPMSPLFCEHNVVEGVHEEVIRSALIKYYRHKLGRRGKQPWSDYANMFLRELFY